MRPALQHQMDRDTVARVEAYHGHIQDMPDDERLHLVGYLASAVRRLLAELEPPAPAPAHPESPLRPPRMTYTTQLVLAALLAAPDGELYGLQLIREAGVKPGSAYPILERLVAHGWAASRRETVHPGRPPRRYFRLTGEGEARARAALAVSATRLALVGGAR